ncbi:hypothetical protein [Mucilaginibacter gotjawali]|uniref:Uncharacterized protein n=1 Tax=Mucilaginibacter gotjawali TaxID=1550579 RepID=A0A839SGR2_9SPHI|nr:hypothetical protein [Mucilaginibacter gotjawali]MBB3056512.1 hypothetical protein [Mucilaginibacter gotjawali]
MIIYYQAGLSDNTGWFLTNTYTFFSQRLQKYIFTCKKYNAYLNNQLRLTL